MISDVQRIFHHHHGHLDDHNHPKSNRFSHPHTFRWSILTAFALWRLERNFFFRVSIYTFQGRSFAGGQWIEQEIMCCCRIKVYKSNQNATDCGTATLIDDIFFGFFFFSLGCSFVLWGIMKFLFNETLLGNCEMPVSTPQLPGKHFHKDVSKNG